MYCIRHTVVWRIRVKASPCALGGCRDPGLPTVPAMDGVVKRTVKRGGVKKGPTDESQCDHSLIDGSLCPEGRTHPCLTPGCDATCSARTAATRAPTTPASALSPGARLRSRDECATERAVDVRCSCQHCAGLCGCAFLHKLFAPRVSLALHQPCGRIRPASLVGALGPVAKGPTAPKATGAGGPNEEPAANVFVATIP